MTSDTERTEAGAESDKELLAAAPAIVTSEDDFGAWLATRGDRLPAGFELEF